LDFGNPDKLRWDNGFFEFDAGGSGLVSYGVVQSGNPTLSWRCVSVDEGNQHVDPETIDLN